MRQLVAVALGGSLGASLRFLLIRLAAPLDAWAIHAGALTANLAGCLAIGALWIWAQRVSVREDLNAFIFTGVIGSYTTFSTYGLLTAELVLERQIWMALGYTLLSNAGGLGCVYGGLLAGRYIFSKKEPS